MNNIVAGLLILYLASGCAVQTVHLFAPVIEQNELDILISKIESTGKQVKVSSAPIPDGVYGNTLVLPIIMDMFSNSVELENILEAIGFPITSVYAGGHQLNHLYTKGNAGVYITEGRVKPNK